MAIFHKTASKLNRKSRSRCRNSKINNFFLYAIPHLIGKTDEMNNDNNDNQQKKKKLRTGNIDTHKFYIQNICAQPSGWRAPTATGFVVSVLTPVI